MAESNATIPMSEYAVSLVMECAKEINFPVYTNFAFLDLFPLNKAVDRAPSSPSCSDIRGFTLTDFVAYILKRYYVGLDVDDVIRKYSTYYHDLLRQHSVDISVDDIIKEIKNDYLLFTGLLLYYINTKSSVPPLPEPDGSGFALQVAMKGSTPKAVAEVISDVVFETYKDLGLYRAAEAKRLVDEFRNQVREAKRTQVEEARPKTSKSKRQSSTEPAANAIAEAALTHCQLQVPEWPSSLSIKSVARYIEVPPGYDEQNFDPQLLDCKTIFNSLPPDVRNRKGVVLNNALAKALAESINSVISGGKKKVEVESEVARAEQVAKSEEQLIESTHEVLERAYESVYGERGFDVKVDETFQFLQKYMELFKLAGIPPSQYKSLLERILVLPPSIRQGLATAVISLLVDYKQGRITYDQLISGLNEVFGIKPPEVPERKVEQPPPLPPPKIAENVIHDRDELLRLVKKGVFKGWTFVFYYKPLNAVVLYSEKTRKPYVTQIPALVQKYSSIQTSTDVGPVVGVLAKIILTPDDKVTIDPRQVRVILVKKIEVPLDVALIAKITEMGLCLFARGADVFLYPNCNVEQEVGSIYKLTNSGPRLIEEKV